MLENEKMMLILTLSASFVFVAGAFFGALCLFLSLLIRVPVVESAMIKVAERRLRRLQEEKDDDQEDEEPGLEDLAEGGHFDDSGVWVPRSRSKVE